MLVVIIVLGGDSHLIGNKVRRVEPDSKLPNHGNIGTSAHGLHEGLGPGLSNCSKIVDKIGLGHSDSGVNDGQCVAALIGNNVDEELGLRVEDSPVGQRVVTDFVKGIARVRNQLAKEDLFVGVKGVLKKRKCDPKIAKNRRQRELRSVKQKKKLR